MPTSDGLIAIGDEWSAYGQGMVGECHSPNDLEVACCSLCITHTVYYTHCVKSLKRQNNLQLDHCQTKRQTFFSQFLIFHHLNLQNDFISAPLQNSSLPKFEIQKLFT